MVNVNVNIIVNVNDDDEMVCQTAKEQHTCIMRVTKT